MNRKTNKHKKQRSDALPEREGIQPISVRAGGLTQFPSHHAFFQLLFLLFLPARPIIRTNRLQDSLVPRPHLSTSAVFIHFIASLSLDTHSDIHTHTHTHTFDSLSALVKVGLEEREEGVGLGGLCISQSRHGWASPIQTASARRLD